MLGTVPGTKKEPGEHEQALTLLVQWETRGQTEFIETSGFIFYYFMNARNCCVNSSKWTDSETGTIAAKGQSWVAEAATTVSCFQPLGAWPDNWGNDPGGSDLPQCSTYVKSACHSPALPVPRKAESCSLCSLPHCIAHGKHPSLLHVPFFCASSPMLLSHS